MLLGLIINTKPPNLDNSTLSVTEADTALHMAYVAQWRLDGYAAAVNHTLKRKTAFNRRVMAQNPGEVVFSKG